MDADHNVNISTDMLLQELALVRDNSFLKIRKKDAEKDMIQIHQWQCMTSLPQQKVYRSKSPYTEFTRFP